MLVIGIGIGLPWGLMDGLAVSVVPKERAGMAAGIFNAVRLAGDGMAIAVVDAMMSASILSGLAAAVPNGGCCGSDGDLGACASGQGKTARLITTVF